LVHRHGTATVANATAVDAGGVGKYVATANGYRPLEVKDGAAKGGGVAEQDAILHRQRSLEVQDGAAAHCGVAGENAIDNRQRPLGGAYRAARFLAGFFVGGAAAAHGGGPVIEQGAPVKNGDRFAVQMAAAHAHGPAIVEAAALSSCGIAAKVG